MFSHQRDEKQNVEYQTLFKPSGHLNSKDTLTTWTYSNLELGASEGGRMSGFLTT